MFNYPIEINHFQGFGEMVTESTVDKIKKTVLESAKNLRIRNKAAEIVISCPDKDYLCEVNSIYWWVKDNCRYLRDIYGTELLHSPLVALDKIEAGNKFCGDCDCMITLTLSLLMSIGFPVALRIAAYGGRSYYQHIYGLVNIKSQWVPIEPIAKDKPLGWEKEGATKLKDYIVKE